MNFITHNISELRAAILEANLHPDETHDITLQGTDADYIVTDFAEELFGWNAFPIVKSDITIHGAYRVLSLSDGLVGRFFVVNAKDNGHPSASLTLRRVILTGGNSGNVGGGAIVNDGQLDIIECGFTHNVGSLGGVIYNGDYCDCSAIDSYFQQNRAIAEATSLFGAHFSSLRLRRCVINDGLNVICLVSNATQHGRQQLLTEGCTIIGKIAITTSGQDLEIGGYGSGTSLITAALSQPLHNFMLQHKLQSTLDGGLFSTRFPQKSQWSIDDLRPAISNTRTDTSVLYALLAEERFDIIREYLQASHHNPVRYPLQSWLFALILHHPGVQYIRFYYDMLFLAAELNLIGDTGQSSMLSPFDEGMIFLLQGHHLLEYLRSDAPKILELIRRKGDITNVYHLSDALVIILQEMLLRGYPLKDDSTLQLLWSTLEPVTLYARRYKQMPLGLIQQEAAVPYSRGDAYAPYVKKPITMTVNDTQFVAEIRPDTQPILNPTTLPNWYGSVKYNTFWEMPGSIRLFTSDKPIHPRWIEDSEYLRPFLPAKSEYALFHPTQCSSEWMIKCWYQWIYWYEVENVQGGDSMTEYRWGLWKLLAAILNLGENATLEQAYAGLSDCLIWQSSPPKPGQQHGGGAEFIILLPDGQRIALLNPTPRAP
jgi:hypothetical protein